MLAKRIVTAIIGIPIAVFVIDYGQWLFAGFISILALLAWREYARMVQNKTVRVWYQAGNVGILLLVGCVWSGNIQEMLFVIWGMLVLHLIRAILYPKHCNINDSIFSVFGFMYIAFSFIHFLLLRFIEPLSTIISPFVVLSVGAAYLWLAFIGTWASDTAAYFVGSRWGKKKLCSAISPGKTVEGAIGGLFGSIIGVCLLGSYFHLPLIHSMMLGILIGFMAPIGDLVESALKRFAGVKDSGTILPGHGGILDRFDSLLFVVPAVYYYVYAFVLS